MHIDPATLGRGGAYRLLTSAIVPRPIAWVGTLSPEGVDNLSPFSYFMAVSSEPPRLAVSVARGRDGALKHTARNILATREFTVAIPEESALDLMHATSAPWEGSEFDAVGVPRGASARVAPPWAGVARVAFECRLHEAFDLGQVHLVVGEVVWAHVADGLLVEGAVDRAQLRPLARLGGEGYSTIGAVLTRAPARVPSRTE
jgi:flavin reductase (DIM6/NTAB) family NADH-FMN oxidoreductase RutF